MRLVILGPGALGSVFGAALAQSGADVTLLGRPAAHLAALRANGLRLRGRDGAIVTVPIPISDDASVVRCADVVIVLVKSGDTGAAMHAIQPFLRSGTPTLSLQNGLGNAETMRSILGNDALILEGVTSQGAMRIGPGEVAHTGEGPTLIGYRDERQRFAAH